MSLYIAAWHDLLFYCDNAHEFDVAWSLVQKIEQEPDFPRDKLKHMRDEARRRLLLVA